MAKTLQFFLDNSGLEGGGFYVKENGTRITTQSNIGGVPWSWGHSYSCTQGGTANLRSDGVIAITYTYNGTAYTEYYQGIYGTSTGINLPQIVPDTASIEATWADILVKIYDANAAVIWSGYAPPDDSTTAPFLIDLERNSGSNTSTTASLELNFGQNTATLTLSDNTEYAYDLTGTTYELDSNDWLNYHQTSLPKKTTTLTPTQLSAPTGIGALSIHPNKMEVSFTGTAGASSYTLEYGVDSTFAAKTTVTDYVSGTEINGLTASTTYYVRLKSVGDGTTYSDSEWSETASGTTRILDLIVSMEHPNVTRDSDSTATVLWNAVSGAVSYTLQWGTDSTFAEKTTIENAVSGLQLTGLTLGTHYYVRIHPHGDGVTIFCPDDVWSEPIPCGVMPQPSITLMIVTAGIHVIIHAQREDCCELRYGKSADFSDAVSIVNFSSNDIITGLEPSTVYYVQARILGNGFSTSNSLWSNSASVTTLQIPLSDVVISGTPQVGEELTAILTPSGATASYQWYRVKSLGFLVREAITGAISARYSPTAADVGRTIQCVASGTDVYTGTVFASTSGTVENADAGWVTIDAFHDFEAVFGEWTRLGAFACGVPVILRDREPN